MSKDIKTAVAFVIAAAMVWVLAYFQGLAAFKQSAIDSGWAHECNWNTYYGLTKFRWGPHAPEDHNTTATVTFTVRGCLQQVCTKCLLEKEYCRHENSTFR